MTSRASGCITSRLQTFSSFQVLQEGLLPEIRWVPEVYTFSTMVTMYYPYWGKTLNPITVNTPMSKS
jgi:hypothetical protein